MVVDLPGVGANLQDHLFVPVCYQSLAEHPPAELISEAGLFLDTGLGTPDGGPGLQFTFGPAKFLPAGAAESDLPGPGFTFAPVGLRPYSRGRLTLADADPATPAAVRPRYLTDQRDLDVLLRGIDLSRELAQARAFDGFRGRELGPGPDVRTRAGLREYVAANATTLWHPVGTCRMGPDPLAVVDADLRVHGVAGLRVADASVMPTIPAGNTNAPSVVIAEKAAELIRDADRTLSEGALQ
jgi:choline dehydrogenase